MNVVRVWAMALTLAIAAGWLAAVGAGPRELRKVAKGAVSGIRETRQEVIRDRTAWEKLWAQHGGLTRPVEKLPDIDFARQMVVVVTMGTQRSGGYGIEILAVEETNHVLRVSVQRTRPQKGAITTQALTAPFHMVAVSKSDLKAEFVEVAGPL